MNTLQGNKLIPIQFWGEHTEERTENLFLKGQVIIQACGPCGLSCNYSTLLLYCEIGHREDINRWVWLDPNTTLFIKTCSGPILLVENGCQPQYRIFFYASLLTSVSKGKTVHYIHYSDKFHGCIHISKLIKQIIHTYTIYVINTLMKLMENIP